MTDTDTRRPVPLAAFRAIRAMLVETPGGEDWRVERPVPTRTRETYLLRHASGRSRAAVLMADGTAGFYGARYGARHPGPDAAYRKTADIAKAIRADLREAQRDGRIPADVTISVRSRDYAGGRSVDVTLSGWDTDRVRVLDPAPGQPWLTPQAAAALDAAKAVHAAHNYDNSDVSSDYFDVDFYGVPSWRF